MSEDYHKAKGQRGQADKVNGTAGRLKQIKIGMTITNLPSCVYGLCKYKIPS